MPKRMLGLVLLLCLVCLAASCSVVLMPVRVVGAVAQHSYQAGERAVASSSQARAERQAKEQAAKKPEAKAQEPPPPAAAEPVPAPVAPPGTAPEMLPPLPDAPHGTSN